ncbi:MarR family transcriptional regulator [Microbacterium sp. RU33B]|uniref:MarR family transcriptional regulator n=1 Tax=Microbacterium sp. RU33B TaxID=1907390 RepID=UPI00095FF4ED|nr:MarR family transcriptional regulator [Microbacterium sp. RU33B]SIT78652.1 DNA-binding transcriptional regulator, MarR family [Microbacterium sp. RU33B]
MDGISGRRESDARSAEAIERGRMRADELSWALRAVNRAAAQLDHALAARMGLRPTDYEAMGHIMDSEGSHLGPVELGQRLGMSTGSATELADRLERAGHILRARDEADRRRVSLVPQSETVGRILGELEPLFTALDDLATDFSDQERDVIERYLREAAQRLETRAEELGNVAAKHAPS